MCGHLSAFKCRSIHLSKSGTKTLQRNISNCHQISKNPLTKSRNWQTWQRRPSNFNSNNRQGEGVKRQSRFYGQFRPQYHDYDINSPRTASRATTRCGCYFCGEQNHPKRSCKFGNLCSVFNVEPLDTNKA